MSPITHLLASWIVAAYTTDNLRDRRLVTLAGVAPDLDGLGIVRDLGGPLLGLPATDYFHTYHHWLGHGLPAALVISAAAACLARWRWRTFWLAMIVFHLHLLCDFFGSRGPSPDDIWPIFYFGPLSYRPMWEWSHQWRLDGWQNRVITVALLAWALPLGARIGESVVAVFNRRADAVFVETLRKWGWAGKPRPSPG